MSGEAAERAEWLWAQLPTMRKWTSLPTHEKALVCHLVAALSTEGVKEAKVTTDTLLGFEAGAREEREAVVAWLRGQCSDPMLPEYAEFLTDYVDAIEQGQHTGGSYGQVDG